MKYFLGIVCLSVALILVCVAAVTLIALGYIALNGG